jgi:DNA-directed RNA polymerase
MSGIEEVANYLRERVEKVNPNNPKANSGAVLLKFYSKFNEEAEKVVVMATDIIQAFFSRDTRAVPAGKAKLTALSTRIGSTITKYITKETMSWRNEICLGDLMLEAFLQRGYIKIFRDPGFSELDKDAPFMVEPTSYWAEINIIPIAEDRDVLVATHHNEPVEINNLFRGGRPIIKGWDDENSKEFNRLLNRPFVNAANKLERQAWKVNKKLYDVINSKLLDILPNIPDMPEEGSKLDLKNAYRAMKKKDNKKTRDRYNKTAALWNRKLNVLRSMSKTNEIRITLRKAEAMLNLEVFYQSIEFDYRGRIYYREPFLNYQGSDMARGLMMFAEGAQLNEDGVAALKVHTANSFNQNYNINEIPSWVEWNYKEYLEKEGLDNISVDKMSLNDRVMWCEENADMILMTATDNTIHDCEKPFVFLACCFEWAAFEADPEHKVCIPTPIDGTCNGYQHSAAIAKDGETGLYVGLEDTTIPVDLYIQVAKELLSSEKQFFEDRGMNLSQIRKGIAKRATMTRAYSAGEETIADSMFSDLYQFGYDIKFNISMLDCEHLAKKIIEAIAKVCPGGQKTMKYLQNLAAYELGMFTVYDKNGDVVSLNQRRKDYEKAKKMRAQLREEPDNLELLKQLNEISNDMTRRTSVLERGNGSNYISWSAPSGFPIRYESFLTRSEKCLSTLRGVEGGQKSQPGRIRHVAQVSTEHADKRAFAAGISPNYIHSQDAAHMAIVISKWNKAFGAVHDSFSTHPNDIKELSQITRDVFREMYEKDNVFEQIKENILSKSEQCDVVVPDNGDLEIELVSDSTYFFA